MYTKNGESTNEVHHPPPAPSNGAPDTRDGPKPRVIGEKKNGVSECDGKCVDFMADVHNCGGCAVNGNTPGRGIDCGEHQGARCYNGVCVYDDDDFKKRRFLSRFRI